MMNIKSVTASLLMVTIVGIGALNVKHLIENPTDEVLTTSNELTSYFNENFVDKFKFVNLYGAVQKWMGKNEVDNFDIVKDDQGKLHFEYFAKGPNDMTEISEAMRDFKQHLDLFGLELAFIMPPDKTIRGYTTFSPGLPYNYSNEGADDFLKQLDTYDIKYVDLREGILESGIDPSQLFFNTDHHWTPQTAFWGFGQVVKFLNEQYNFDLNEVYSKVEQYEFVNLPQCFLGSQGKRTGVIYSGLDDFMVIQPTFETLLTYTWAGQSVTGPFNETVLRTEWLSSNLGIEADRYMTYLGGNYGEVTITNHLNEDGPKILMIKDSFMLPLAAFLSTSVEEIKLIDLRYYEGQNLYELVQTYRPDVVLVSASPTDLVPDFFNFVGGDLNGD